MAEYLVQSLKLATPEEIKIGNTIWRKLLIFKGSESVVSSGKQDKCRRKELKGKIKNGKNDLMNMGKEDDQEAFVNLEKDIAALEEELNSYMAVDEITKNIKRNEKIAKTIWDQIRDMRRETGMLVCTLCRSLELDWYTNFFLSGVVFLVRRDDINLVFAASVRWYTVRLI